MTADDGQKPARFVTVVTSTLCLNSVLMNAFKLWAKACGHVGYIAEQVGLNTLFCKKTLYSC